MAGILDQKSFALRQFKKMSLRETRLNSQLSQNQLIQDRYEQCVRVVSSLVAILNECRPRPEFEQDNALLTRMTRISNEFLGLDLSDLVQDSMPRNQLHDILSKDHFEHELLRFLRNLL